ncbi:MAG: hypothetical protein IKT34_03910 [Clostridia bacterium]|nr:hypothetical protein [Clostridia bacterium]
MKTKSIIFTTIPIILLIWFLLLPLFTLIGLIKGLEFSLNRELMFAIISTLLAVGTVVSFFIVKPELNLASHILLTLLLPIVICNSLCLASPQKLASLILMLVCGGCIFAVYFKFLDDSGFKATSAVFSVLLTIALAVLVIWGIINTRFINQKTEQLTINSPSKDYVAVVCTEKSLFSADTVIYIRLAEPVGKAPFGSYRVKDMLVYEGEEYEYKSAYVAWLDDSTLIVNDKGYSVTLGE